MFKSLLLLLTLLSTMSLVGSGCASPSCEDLTEHLKSCTSQLLNDYGTNTQKTCVLGKKKACSGNQICMQPKGAVVAHCFIPQNVNQEFILLVNAVSRSCGSIFAAHHKDYMNCIVASERRCDLEKINACAAKYIKPVGAVRKSGESAINYIIGLILLISVVFLLRMVLHPVGLHVFSMKKISTSNVLLSLAFALILPPLLLIEGDIGKFLFGLPIFVVIGLLLEGLLVFVGLKFSDKSNPKNSIKSAILFGLLMSLLTYPWLYGYPLPGLFITSSLLFGLLIVIYEQDISFATGVTLLHMIWIWGFFTFFAASHHLGGEAWFIQKKHFKIELRKEQRGLAKTVKEAKKMQEMEADAKLRAKEAAITSKKEKEDEAKLKAAEKKKKAEEAKKPKPAPRKKRRRRRRRR